MSNKSSFEDKMRSKLESYEAPYDKKYWKGFTKAYPTILKTSFWQAWYWPYAFSTLLFALGYWWFAPLENGRSGLAASTNLRDTLFVKETIYVRDTLVIKDTLYVVNYAAAEQNVSSSTPAKMARLSKVEKSKVTALQPESATNIPVSMASAYESTPVTDNPSSSASFSTQAESPSQTITPSAASTKKLQGDIANSNALLSDSSAAMPIENAATLAESNTPRDSSAMVSSEAIETIDAFEEAEDNRKIPVFLTGGPRSTVFLPFSSNRNFDTYFGAFAGGQLAVELGDFALSAGLQYGLWHNEFDDLNEILPSRFAQFPNYAGLPVVPTEIEIVTQHLLVPLELSWLFYERRKWYARLSAGALGNHLLRETFLYNAEDAEYRGSTGAGSSGWVISHLNAGLGLSYQWNQRMELQSQFSYFHPLQPLGLSNLKTGALGVQIGVNWLLLPR